jgi:hypothetical protein
MLSYENMVNLLSGVHVTDKNLSREKIVSVNIIEDALKQLSYNLSKNKKQSLINNSAIRISNNYKQKRKLRELTTKEAAEEAIAEEQDIIEQLLCSNTPKVVKQFVIGDRIEVIKHIEKRYIGMVGIVIHIGSRYKTITEAIDSNLPRQATESSYSIKLDSGEELHNLRGEQLHKMNIK